MEFNVLFVFCCCLSKLLKLTTGHHVTAPPAQEHPEETPGPHEEGLRWAEENAIFVDELPAFRNEDPATVAWTLVNYAEQKWISMVVLTLDPNVYILFILYIRIYIRITYTYRHYIL